METASPGHLVVTLNPRSWGGGEYDPNEVTTLQYVSKTMGTMLFAADDDVAELLVQTPGGEMQDPETNPATYAHLYD